MQLAATYSILDRIGDAVGAFFLRIANAHWAAKDFERYAAMTDEELAAHDMTRDQIAEKVLGRYTV